MDGSWLFSISLPGQWLLTAGRSALCWYGPVSVISPSQLSTMQCWVRVTAKHWCQFTEITVSGLSWSWHHAHTWRSVAVVLLGLKINVFQLTHYIRLWSVINVLLGLLTVCNIIALNAGVCRSNKFCYYNLHPLNCSGCQIGYPYAKIKQF